MAVEKPLPTGAAKRGVATKRAACSFESDEDGDDDEKQEGGDGDEPETDRTFSHGGGSAKIPEDCDDDDSEFERDRAVTAGEPGSQVLEVENEGGGVDGHVEDGG